MKTEIQEAIEQLKKMNEIGDNIIELLSESNEEIGTQSSEDEKEVCNWDFKNRETECGKHIIGDLALVYEIDDYFINCPYCSKKIKGK